MEPSPPACSLSFSSASWSSAPSVSSSKAENCMCSPPVGAQPGRCACPPACTAKGSPSVRKTSRRVSVYVTSPPLPPSAIAEAAALARTDLRSSSARAFVKADTGSSSNCPAWSALSPYRPISATFAPFSSCEAMSAANSFGRSSALRAFVADTASPPASRAPPMGPSARRSAACGATRRRMQVGSKLRTSTRGCTESSTSTHPLRLASGEAESRRQNAGQGDSIHTSADQPETAVLDAAARTSWAPSLSFPASALPLPLPAAPTPRVAARRSNHSTLTRAPRPSAPSAPSAPAPAPAPVSSAPPPART
mmetsp:Transcript_34716/g.80214  ORF Transcript_34716/g.80214 Transcript_34716/m.80214 type:complete len:309 (-) Transcript_34716:79-1005(-)